MLSFEESAAKLKKDNPSRTLRNLLTAIRLGDNHRATVAAENLANSLRRGHVPKIDLDEAMPDGSIKVLVWNTPDE